jgi:hypothetical protein
MPSNLKQDKLCLRIVNSIGPTKQSQSTLKMENNFITNPQAKSKKTVKRKNKKQNKQLRKRKPKRRNKALSTGKVQPRRRKRRRKKLIKFYKENLY